MSKEFTQRCEAVGLKEGSLFTWLEKVETLQAENAALKEQVAQLEFRNERLVADYAELQGLNENHAFNAKYFKAENEALKQQVEQGKRDAVPEGYTLVPTEILDRFPEINPSNYDHDDANR